MIVTDLLQLTLQALKVFAAHCKDIICIVVL